VKRMFSKRSRYRKLPDVVTTDRESPAKEGRTHESKALRLLPDVQGAFIHKVEEGDRLDHLAYKYYRQPEKWWRICDANPEFLSPLAMLGKEPFVTCRFPLVFSGSGQPPWALLLKRLREKVGVENIQVVEEVRIVPEEERISGKVVTVNTEQYERAVILTYNSINIGSDELTRVIDSAGFAAGHPENTGRVGKEISIPPDAMT